MFKKVIFLTLCFFSIVTVAQKNHKVTIAEGEEYVSRQVASKYVSNKWTVDLDEVKKVLQNQKGKLFNVSFDRNDNPVLSRLDSGVKEGDFTLAANQVEEMVNQKELGATDLLIEEGEKESKDSTFVLSITNSVGSKVGEYSLQLIDPCPPNCYN